MSRIDEIKERIASAERDGTASEAWGQLEVEAFRDITYLLSRLNMAETALSAIAGEELPFGAKLGLPPIEAAKEALKQLRS